MDMALAVTMAMAMSMLNRMGVTGIGAVTQLFMPRSILLATSIYTTTHGRVVFGLAVVSRLHHRCFRQAGVRRAQGDGRRGGIRVVTWVDHVRVY